MLPVFIACFAAGAVLIGASLVFGGDDIDADIDADIDPEFDVDTEVDIEVDADMDTDLDVGPDIDAEFAGETDLAEVAEEAVQGAGQAWIPFLSMRFWTFAAAAFGLTGMLLSLFGLGDLISSLIASPVGLGMGLYAAYLFRYLKQNDVSADLGLQRLVGNEARVLLTVRPGGRGKIVVEDPSGRLELFAETGDDSSLAVGSTVLIAHVDKEGVASVTGLGGELNSARLPRQQVATDPVQAGRDTVRESD